MKNSWLFGLVMTGLFVGMGTFAFATDEKKADVRSEEHVLNYHLMHPGGDSSPGDPNAAFYLDGTYHMHYILSHRWQEKGSFSFIHVTSPDMLHWTWQKTTLQPSFTGHGMFSGTGFITKEGKPAIVYAGEGTGKSQIAIAKDNSLNQWEKPYPIMVTTADGNLAPKERQPEGDPDCFLVGDTYYCYSRGRALVKSPDLNAFDYYKCVASLIKSPDLKKWTHVGNLMAQDMPDVIVGEDMSCGNFFKLGEKWMWLGISHQLGCRYYLGDWDAKAEQFVPEKHGRMNWRRESQNVFGMWRVDYFAPESLLAADGRRIMWAWLACIGSGSMGQRTIQSLPRELSLPADGILRIKPLRELESLRFDPVTLSEIKLGKTSNRVQADGGSTTLQKLADLGGDAVEIRVTVARDQAARKIFGFTLFADEKGAGGLPIMLRPENGTLRVGTAEAPFAVADLPAGEDLDLRIFVDKYLVEVFANDRQAMVSSYAEYRGKTDLNAFTVGAPTTLKNVEIWKLKPTNQGFRDAQKNRIWEPETEPPPSPATP